MSIRPRLTDLRCEHLVNPLGLDEPIPRFSWKLADTRIGATQIAYQIEVSARDAVIWDSRRVDADTSVLIPYAGPVLRPHTRYHWRARIWDHTGVVTSWSKTTWFETGFLNPLSTWPSAEWIHRPIPKSPADRPAVELRKTFHLPAAPREARLYITARGIFEPQLNGKRIGRDHLTPRIPHLRRHRPTHRRREHPRRPPLRRLVLRLFRLQDPTRQLRRPTRALRHSTSSRIRRLRPLDRH